MIGGYYFNREIGKTWVIFIKNSFDIDSMCGAKLKNNSARPWSTSYWEKKEERTSRH